MLRKAKSALQLKIAVSKRSTKSKEQVSKLSRYCAARKRAGETANQAGERRECNRACAARKRAVETAD